MVLLFQVYLYRTSKGGCANGNLMGRINRSDLVGQKFNMLTVISFSHRNGYQKYWLCKCDCGNEKSILQGNITSGYTKSCGCHHASVMSLMNTKHGEAGKNTITKEYTIWAGMIGRCTNQNSSNYNRYGGRGISVCERWLQFENFIADMGRCPDGHSLDRFPDKNGNYEFNNCRWATAKEQAHNTRRNKWLEYNGRKMILQDWAKELKTHHTNIIQRLKKSSFEHIVEDLKRKAS